MAWQQAFAAHVSRFTGRPVYDETDVFFQDGNSTHGVNVAYLWAMQQDQRYSTGHWLAYRQAQKLGGQVRKGEHPTPAVFYKAIEKETNEVDADGEAVTKQICILRPLTDLLRRGGRGHQGPGPNGRRDRRLSHGGGEVSRYMARHDGKGVKQAALMSSIAPFISTFGHQPDKPLPDLAMWACDQCFHCYFHGCVVCQDIARTTPPSTRIGAPLVAEDRGLAR